MDKDLMYLVYGIVMEIPRGKVSTYGQIARLALHVLKIQD